MEKIKNIWIVITTFNAENWIGACLKSIEQSSVKANVVIVDNCSRDNTNKIIKEKYPDAILINNQKNIGFGNANNIGIRHALAHGAECIVLLNQDAKLHCETIKDLLVYSQKYPEYGILSPMFYSYDGQSLDVYTLRWTLTYDLALASDLFFRRAKEVYDVNLMPAAMWFIPRKALEDTGGFDPMFFMYGEDEDLWGRVKSKGWKTGLFPAAKVYHHTAENNFTLKKRKWHSYATTVLSLKNYNHSFSKNLFFYFRNYLRNSFISVIDLNKSELYVTQVTFCKTFFCLRKIYRNRKLCHEGKMPFL